MVSSQEERNEPSLRKDLNPIAGVIRPYSQSPVPMWIVSGIFLASSVVPPNPLRPPLMQRLGFGAIFAGAGYVTSTGDIYNGTGISTAWSLTYLFLNIRKALRPPRSSLSLILSSAALFSSTLYGTEYFLLQEKDDS
ncbi:hypothetical protein QCA50_011273 [Cerrena zonata]|uniref:Uncharacterized protein n=1 Tax=Cerrena zonata TaxID=2478898 RepID=A0AAW0FW30_9APHY